VCDGSIRKEIPGADIAIHAEPLEEPLPATAGRVTPHSKVSAHRIACLQEWIANDFHSERSIDYMTLLFSPVIGSAIWIGGGGVGLLLVIIVVVLLVRR
jgi:hypothetical protein